jgi:methionyl-tRNA synthetase
MHERYLITSALPYINGVKHLGNLVGSMLPADVYARFLRQQGQEVLFLCATDEHGTPAELAAAAAGETPQAFCDKMHQIHKDLVERFHLSFDHFGRSSSEQNHELTQHLCDRLEQEGFIEERVIKQYFSVADNRFLADRYITGTCPHCGNVNARGDQCEACTHVLDPTELIDPRSSISGSTELELRNTHHLFLKYAALQPRIKEWLNQRFDWPGQVTASAH